jgi:hypothetical protein
MEHNDQVCRSGNANAFEVSASNLDFECALRQATTTLFPVLSNPLKTAYPHYIQYLQLIQHRYITDAPTLFTARYARLIGI